MHLSKNARVDRIVNQIDVVNRIEDAKTFIQSVLTKKPLAVVGFVNAHAVQMSQSNHAFFDDLTGCDFLLRDGVGLELLMKSGSMCPGENMNGTDFIPALVQAASEKGFKCLLLGTEEPYLSKAVLHLKSKGVDVVGQDNGFHTEGYYLDYLSSYSNSDLLVILGMGMPKQEGVAAFIKSNIEHNGSLVVICGGAIIDFWGGKVERAPKILRKVRMEWFYRFLQEPRRLWRRYFLGALSLSFLCFSFFLNKRFGHKKI